MNKREFEVLTGKPIEADLYAQIERIYMNASDAWDKTSFCRVIKNANGETISLMVDLAQQVERLIIKNQNRLHDIEMKDETIKELKADNDTLRDQRNQAEAALHTTKEQRIELALALVNNGLDAQAIEIIGHEEVIGIKASLNLPLSEIDRVFLVNKFCNR